MSSAVVSRSHRISLRCLRRHSVSVFSRCQSSKSEIPPTSTGLPKPRLDYRDISDNVVFKSHNAFNRKAPLPVGAIQNIASLYEKQKNLANALNSKRHARSTVGERIRQAAKKPEAKIVALEEAKTLKNEIADLERQLEEVENNLFRLAIAVPNDTHPEVPLGPESAAVVLSQHGPIPLDANPERDHVTVGRSLSLIDLEAGATVTGSSWYYLIDEGALLEIALINYALSIATKHGFTFVTTPDVVRTDVAWRCGFQPRDPHADPPVSQMYHIQTHLNAPTNLDGSVSQSHPELVLAGTAEIPLAGMFANKILHTMPTKVVGLGRAFRAEAGARGADTRGLYRVHQFTKLELFVLSPEDQSEAMMEEIRKVQTEIFEGLGFPFRVLDMPTEELGASAYRKYDMEAWMPGRGGWGEISSTSNCTDYQARRLHIRYRRPVDGEPADRPSTAPPSIPFVHTLNGTAAAIPRLIVTLIENGARFDKDRELQGLDLPKTLRPYWMGPVNNDKIRFV